MQSLNDDMDELFRRAAEEYPLNTNGADWNKVMQELHHAVSALPKDEKKKDYRFLWLLLLLPIGFMIGRYIGNNNNNINDSGNKEVNKAAVSAGKTVPVTPAPGVAINDGNSNTAVASRDQVKAAIDNKPDHDNGNPTAGNTHRLINDHKAVSDVSLLPKTRSKANSSFSNAAPILGGRNNKADNSFSAIPSNQLAVDKKEENEITTGKPGSPVKAEVLSTAEQPLTKADASVASASDKGKEQQEPSSAPANSKSSKSKDLKTFQPKFSYSFIIGPDLSTVKLQRTSKVGYSLGLVLGYKVSRKVTLEAGVLWDRKNYYTDGKYVDTSRLKLPMRSIVKFASGYCNMVEIPVNIRYDFATKQNHSWFVSAGLSSYLMAEEDYNLTYERYNQPYTKDYGYMHSTKDWFSIMNVSLGYQKSLGKHTNISVAPYVKLPLRGVGIGKLPVSSTGIYVGVSRFIK